MAKSERQRGSLKSEELFFDSDASLLDQHDFEMSNYAFSDVFNSKDSHMDQINTFLKNVQVLLEAARFLESAERKDGSEFICAAFDPFHLENKISLSTDLDNKGLSLSSYKHHCCPRAQPGHFTISYLQL